MPDLPAVDFKHFIRLVGRGQRAGRTLTMPEAEQAMTMLINGQVTPEQKGAFLMLLRVREETPEELAGFTKALRAYTIPEVGGLRADLDMGCYAGKRRHLPWFLLAVILMGLNGKRIFLHGTHEPDSKRLYLKEVLPQLGFSVASNVEQAEASINELGFAYMDLNLVNPQLDSIIQLREQFGLRSCANTLARMLNPSNATCSLQGIFHRHVDEKHRNAAALLNDKNVLCFRGEGGEIEFNPQRDVTLHVSRQSEQNCLEVIATSDTYITKPKVLDATQMIDVWNGKSENQYANQTVIGTLAIMLVLTDGLSWTLAYEKSEVMWKNRERTWPVNLPEAASPKDDVFYTDGKHYAH